jgi:hypothetical protein
LDFIKIFDISGDQKMLKQIITLGEGLIKPFENNYININLKIFIENQIFIEKEKSCFLNIENFTEGEITMIKSMKKYEHSRIDISWDYFFQEILKNSKFFDEEKFWDFLEKKTFNNNNNTYNTYNTYNKTNTNKRYRITYEINLNKLKNNKSFKTYKKINYESTTLVKGIGNICPWDRSLMKFLMKIKFEDKEIYSDEFLNLELGQLEKIESKAKANEINGKDNDNGSDNYNDNGNHKNNYKENEFKFAEKIKDIKKIIKTKPNYLLKIQYLIDELVKNKTLIDPDIYDPLSQNLPEIFSEVLKTMKILQVEKINFSLNSTEIKEELIRLSNKDIDFIELINAENLHDSKNLQNFNFEITFCLLNFQENYSIFNKNIILYNEDEKIEKLKSYKNSANFFFAKNKLNKAKKINKFLANEYLKYLNVDKILHTGDLLVKNKSEFFHPKILFDFFDTKKYSKIPKNFERLFYEEMKKVFCNLLLIYFKLNKIKKFEEFFNLFFHVFKNEYEFEADKFKIIENSLSSSYRKKFFEFFFIDEIYEKVLYIKNKFCIKLGLFSASEILVKKMLSCYHIDFNFDEISIFEYKQKFIDTIDNFDTIDNAYNFVDTDIVSIKKSEVEDLRKKYNNYKKEYEDVLINLKKSEESRNNMYKKMFKN